MCLPPGKAKADCWGFVSLGHRRYGLPAFFYPAAGKEFFMAWINLLIAGILEVVWSTCLKLSEGFTIIKFTIPTLIGMVLSFVFLSQAVKVLPLGTSYAIWTGIGAFGAVVVGILYFKEPATAIRMLFIAMILIGIIGLKLTSPAE